MALQMFACTVTQMCVVNYLPAIRRRQNRPIDDESDSPGRSMAH